VDARGTGRRRERSGAARTILRTPRRTVWSGAQCASERVMRRGYCDRGATMTGTFTDANGKDRH
jgi:hypothetical protein